MVETEFENTVRIEPLYVDLSSENYKNSSGFEHKIFKVLVPFNILKRTSSGYYYLDFYKNREKTEKAVPFPDIIFEIESNSSEILYNYRATFRPIRWMDLDSLRREWRLKKGKMTKKTDIENFRNIDFQTRIGVGKSGDEMREVHMFYTKEDLQVLRAKYAFPLSYKSFNIHLRPSPFFIII